MTRWILSEPEAGKLRHLSYNSLRQYVQHLRLTIIEESKPATARKRFVRQLAKQILRQQIRTANVLSVRQPLEKVEGGKPSGISVPQVDSIKSIEADLNELFKSDPVELLRDLMALNRRSVPEDALAP